jgi:hypothetical protein
MVKLLLRALRVSVQTKVGEYGADISFPNGLVVLRAENSAGKSTLVQSIIYAMGLEGMLSASRDVPLPHAMTDIIEDGTAKHEVLSSHVELEIENHAGQRATLVRHAKSSGNRNLVTLIHGPALSIPNPEEPYRREDKFVRDPGAATIEAGLHYWLTSFLGWTLPIVTRFDGTECPLYLECMFPLMLVEQKKAWTGIQARMPTQYRIRDVSKRAVEFVMNLSTFETIAKRQQLRTRQDGIERQWQNHSAAASSAARQAGGIIGGVESEPMIEWPGELVATMLLNRNGSWVGVAEAANKDRAVIEALQKEEIPTVEAAADGLAQLLAAAEDELAVLQLALSDIFEDVKSKRSQLVALDARLDDLAESLDGNRSVKKLRNMGSLKALSSVHDHVCPTCHQEVDDSVLPQHHNEQAMSLDDNIAFIETQQRIYRATKDGLTRALAAQEATLVSLRNEDTAMRGRIRSLKSTLVTEGHTPSRAAIEALVAAESRLAKTLDAEASVRSAFQNLEILCEQWKVLQGEIKAMPKDGLSPEDRNKLNALQKLFQDHARAFGVSSLDPASIALSPDTYKPSHEGFDLDFDLSASDLIRTIWAYLHALLELSRFEETNHLGLLVLDEPRQQETKRESFAEFFKRAADADKHNQQVIVATSENSSTLDGLLNGLRHSYIQFTGAKVLTKR